MKSKAVAIFFGVAGVVLAISAVRSGAARFSHNFSEERPSYKWLEKWKAVCLRNSKPFPAFVPELQIITADLHKPKKSPSKSKKAGERSTVHKNPTKPKTSRSPEAASNAVKAPTYHQEKTPPESEELAIGTLSVHSTPSGATVFVDGNNVGRTPIDVDVFTGKHQVRVIHPSEPSERQRRVSVKAGEAAQLDIEF